MHQEKEEIGKAKVKDENQPLSTIKKSNRSFRRQQIQSQNFTGHLERED